MRRDETPCWIDEELCIIIEKIFRYNGSYDVLYEVFSDLLLRGFRIVLS